MSTLTINTDELSIESLTEILKILKRERGTNERQPTNVANANTIQPPTIQPPVQKPTQPIGQPTQPVQQPVQPPVAPPQAPVGQPAQQPTQSPAIQPPVAPQTFEQQEIERLRLEVKNAIRTCIANQGETGQARLQAVFTAYGASSWTEIESRLNTLADWQTYHQFVVNAINGVV